MVKKKILFIGGSVNQTTMMHKISKHLCNSYDCYFTPFYTDGFLEVVRKTGFLDFTILGGKFRKNTEEYLSENNLAVDYRGETNNYDLVFTGSDLIVPKNIRTKKIILVQEGMTDPENLVYYIVKYLKLPRYFASTSTNGLSDMYDFFCVASEGYKDFFINKGVKESKVVVTGIPNFDNAEEFYKNNFELKNYVLVATSDARETFKYENRKAFIKEAIKIADGRQLIFKLHPNEKVDRAKKEIKEIIPEAIVYSDYNINHLIANCSVLVTKYSSVVYIGLALGKEVYSYFDIEVLKRMTPLQNSGTSSEKIALLGRNLLEGKIEMRHQDQKTKSIWNLGSEINCTSDTGCSTSR